MESTTSYPRINTVTGPMRPESLGITMTHEHLMIDGEWPRERHTFDLMLDNETLASEEIDHYLDAGGRTVVECTASDIGRDPLALKRISEATGVQVVMGCGWYRDPYYPPDVNELPVDELSHQLIDEIQNGVGDTGIRPGVIGEIGSHKGFVSAQEERVLRAAARAAIKTGLPISTHSIPTLRDTQRIGQGVGLQQLDVLIEEGLPSDRIIVGHCDTWIHLDYHLGIVERGAFIQFDGIGATTWLGVGDAPWLEEQLIDHMMKLIDRGFLDQIVISEDVCRKSNMKAFGGKGYDYLLRSFVPRMNKGGIDEEQTHKILVENPKRALTPRVMGATRVKHNH